MKKITALFLALVLAAFTITACSSTNENTAQTDEPAATTESSSDQAATTSGSTKTLIVYYSATGNTEEVSNDIAQATG